MDTVALRPFTADDAAWVVDCHARLYARECGFDDSFRAAVAAIVADFATRRATEGERGWIAEARRGDDAQRIGCIFCCRLDAQTAQLRLFLLEPEARGQGLGRRLLDTCTGFARAAGYDTMRLWTHGEHRAACRLYARAGFARVSSRACQSYGRALTEQCWQRAL